MECHKKTNQQQKTTTQYIVLATVVPCIQRIKNEIYTNIADILYFMVKGKAYLMNLMTLGQYFVENWCHFRTV